MTSWRTLRVAGILASTTSLTLSEDGQLIFESRKVIVSIPANAPLRDLDPNAIEVLNEQEMVVRVSCEKVENVGDGKNASGIEKWTLRDKKWRPESQYQGRPHKLTGLELRLSSNERSANRVAEVGLYAQNSEDTRRFCGPATLWNAQASRS